MSDAPRAAQPTRFMVLVYRVPARPTANRVYVWRMLKKMGAVYLQQSVCVFPQNARVNRELRPVLAKIEESGGEFHLLPLRSLEPDEERKLVAQFVEQATRHYQEIIENCEVDFTKEIEFETFRQNYTYEEAEEIRSEFEKIVAWFGRVRERDWFGAPNRAEAEGWLARCSGMLEEFEAKVFSTQQPALEGSARDRRSAPHGRSRGGASKAVIVPDIAEGTPPRNDDAPGTTGTSQAPPRGEAATADGRASSRGSDAPEDVRAAAGSTRRPAGS